MQRFWAKWTVEHTLLFGICIFVLLQLAIILRTHAIFWDEAVFLSMGKFVASGSALGFWEHIRPPLLPLLIAGTLLLGAPIFLTKCVLVLLAALAGVLLYRLLVPHVRASIAVAAAILFLFSQLWFAYANLILTDVFSASIAVVAAWLYARSRFFAAGVVAALAFLTRFPAGLLFAGLLLAQLLALSDTRTKRIAINTWWLLAGFLLPVLLWMIANMFAWHDDVSLLQAAIRPLADGFMTASAENADLYHVETGFYLMYLLQKVPIVLLGFLGLRFLPRAPAGTPLVMATLLGLVFFEWLPNDQLRFLLLLLPGLILLAAWGGELAASFLKRGSVIITAFFLLSIAFVLIDDVALLTLERVNQPQAIEYYEYLAEHPVEGFVLVTDPAVAWHAPNKAVPVYYGLFAYTDSFIPAAAAIAVEQEHTCTTIVCTEQWAIIEAEYTPVYNGTGTIYLRNDLVR